MKPVRMLLLCAGAASLAFGAWVTGGPGIARTRSTVKPALSMDIAAAGTERAKLEEVVATVAALLKDEKLWTNFSAVAARYPQIHVGPGFSANGMTDPAGAVALLRGRNPLYLVFPTQLTLTGTYYDKGPDYTGTCTNPSGATAPCRTTAFRQNYSNEMVVTHGLGPPRPGQYERVSIEIGRTVFDRYNSPSVVRRSCTYNSLAHEWTHTIGKDQDAHRSIVVDTNVSVPAGVPKLSYLFGSVAQCTWLQNGRHIGASAADLNACVQRFGTSDFRSGQCI